MMMKRSKNIPWLAAELAVEKKALPSPNEFERQTECV